jgi:hypothetical protein
MLRRYPVIFHEAQAGIDGNTAIDKALDGEF